MIGKEFIFQKSSEIRYGWEFDLPFGLIVEARDVRKNGTIDIERVGDDWAFTHNVTLSDLKEREFTQEEVDADQEAVFQIESENESHRQSSRPY